MVKPWIKRTVLGALGGLFVIGGLAACAHHRGPMDEAQIGQMRGKAVERISGKLDLNEAQKAKLGALADEMLAQRQALRGGAEPRTEMQSLIAGNQFDRVRAQALLEQKTQAVQGNGPKVIAAMADFYDSLNADQQAKVRAFMAERRHGWWGRG